MRDLSLESVTTKGKQISFIGTKFQFNLLISGKHKLKHHLVSSHFHAQSLFDRKHLKFESVATI